MNIWLWLLLAHFVGVWIYGSLRTANAICNSTFIHEDDLADWTFPLSILIASFLWEIGLTDLIIYKLRKKSRKNKYKKALPDSVVLFFLI
jgi:hypothetical protein